MTMSAQQSLSDLKGVEMTLVEALKEQIDLDKDLELCKQDLALRADFNILDAFRIFDVQGKGCLSISELESGIQELGIVLNLSDLHLCIRQFDKRSDGKIRYSDFCDTVTPKQAEYCNLLNNRTPNETSMKKYAFCSETRAQLVRLFQLIFKVEKASEDLRYRLSSAKFNIHQAFEMIDRNQTGWITGEEFRVFLRDHGIYTSDKDLMILMLRYDKNQDGKVSYSEFVQEISPKSPFRPSLY